MRKCNGIIRKNVRQLDRDINQLKVLDQKTKQYILQASKRGQKNPSQAKQAAQETRTFARELIRVRKQSARLHTSKAQLQSVQMQVAEAFSVRKIEGSLKASTSIMKDVNMLVRLPELTGTMRELSQELMRSATWQVGQGWGCRRAATPTTCGRGRELRRTRSDSGADERQIRSFTELNTHLLPLILL
jgi:myosin heavy subunit